MTPRKRNGKIFGGIHISLSNVKIKGVQLRFAEELQTDIGVARVRQWAKEKHAMKDDDIFISTNVDEVLNNNPKPILKVSF